jgi:Ni,Fe-hydrogenase I large subunit
MGSVTLAPLQEALYSPQHLSRRDSNVLNNIAKTSVRNIETTLGALTHLLENIKMYKETMIDCINIQAEIADMSMKYAVNPVQQSHTLPGVISSPQMYDLKDIKSDNERMQQLKEEQTKCDQQKNLYMRLVSEDFRLLISSYKRMSWSNQSFDTFVESLNDQINANY